MDDNFIKSLQEQARTTDAVKHELKQNMLKMEEACELAKESQINRVVETINNTFQPICNIIKATAIEAAKNALYTEKRGQKILLGQVRLYFPYYNNLSETHYNGCCYCRFEKKQRNGFKSQMVYEYNKKGIEISQEKYGDMWLPNYYLPKPYKNSNVWLLHQIDKVLKEIMLKNIDGMFIGKKVCLACIYDETPKDYLEYKLQFKIFF